MENPFPLCRVLDKNQTHNVYSFFMNLDVVTRIRSGVVRIRPYLFRVFFRVFFRVGLSRTI